MRRTPGGRVPEGTALGDVDVSVTEWLAGQDLPRPTAEFVNAWAAMYGGCAPSDVSILMFSRMTAAFGNSAFSLFDGLAEKFAHGTSDLVRRIADDSGADIRLSTPVEAVTDDGTLVTVRTAAGEELTARWLVCTVPLNVVSSIRFSPKLPERMTTAIGVGNPCRSLKVWAAVENMPPSLFGLGWDVGLEWISGEYTLDDGRQLVVGFGHDSAQIDVTDRESVAARSASSCPRRSSRTSTRTTGTATVVPGRLGRVGAGLGRGRACDGVRRVPRPCGIRKQRFRADVVRLDRRRYRERRRGRIPRRRGGAARARDELTARSRRRAPP
jgi:hypothetical protein